MALENPTYLEDFVSANPASEDQRHEGDDHLRRMKVALKNTFPGMIGRAWRTRNVSGSGPINSTDNMVLLNASGGITLTPAAAATLGNGFMAIVRAPSGSVTINPGEPINGVDQFIVPQNYIAFLFSNGTEFFTLLTYQDVPPSVPVFPSGTRLVFQQTTPPVGWTKVTSAVYNDSAMRVTTGTVGTGGADVFTTVFGSGKTTAGHSLSAAQNGAHTHTGGRSSSGIGVGSGWGGGSASELSSLIDTGSSGSGTAHTHGLTMNIKYTDVIVATKD